MRSRRLLIGIIAVIVLLGAVVAISIFTNRSTLTLVFNDEIESVTISHADINDTVTQLDTAGSISLKHGQYIITPNGDTIKSSATELDFNNNQTIELVPSYTDAYLAKLAQTAMGDINNLYRTDFSSQMRSYKIHTVQLFDRGLWGGVILVPKDFDELNSKGIVRSLIEKKGSKWSITGTPSFVLMTKDFPDIDIEKLTAVNAIGI